MRFTKTREYRRKKRCNKCTFELTRVIKAVEILPSKTAKLNINHAGGGRMLSRSSGKLQTENSSLLFPEQEPRKQESFTFTEAFEQKLQPTDQVCGFFTFPPRSSIKRWKHFMFTGGCRRILPPKVFTRLTFLKLYFNTKRDNRIIRRKWSSDVRRASIKGIRRLNVSFF